jgi:carbamoyl-phosphate synthase large subunit
MQPPINILLTSAGRRVSLVKNFQSAIAQLLSSTAKLLTTDLDPSTAPACHFSDGAFAVGRFNSPTYADELLELCIKNHVGLVVPTIDTELQVLADSQNDFRSAGVQIVISSPSLVTECRDKRKTLKLFESLGIQVPAPINPSAPTFPMFIKPISGSSSKDIFLAKSLDELSPFLTDTNRYIHQEYLPSEQFNEFTVDMYFDQNSTLKCAVPRLRMAVRGGEVSKGRTAKDAFYHLCLRHFANLAGARGCITAQLFCNKTTGEIYGIEINPRFGGGYPLSFAAGADFPEMLIREYLRGEEISFFDGWEDGLRMLRYDSELYLHGN